MKIDNVMKFLIGVLERTGEVVVHNKKEAEYLAEQFNAEIINANQGSYLVTKNIIK